MGYEAARRGHERQERNLRPVLAPTGVLPSGRPGTSPAACGRNRAAASPTAPLGSERAGRYVRRGRSVGTRLEDGDWDIGVFLTDLPSLAEHDPVRTEADPEHRVAKSHACRRPSGAREGIQARAPPGARAAHVRLVLRPLSGGPQDPAREQPRHPDLDARASPSLWWLSWPPRPCVAGWARSNGGEPVRGPLRRGGRTVPKDASALEVCDEC